MVGIFQVFKINITYYKYSEFFFLFYYLELDLYW